MLTQIITPHNLIRSISINKNKGEKLFKRFFSYRRGLRTSKSSKPLIRKTYTENPILLLEHVEKDPEEKTTKLVDEEKPTPWDDYDVNLKTYHQLAIFDIDKEITTNEIEESLYDFDIKCKYEIELFTFENEFEETRNAIIYLPNDEVYHKLLAWNAENLGIILRCKRYILQKFSDYKTLIFDRDQLEMTHRFLSTKFNVSPSDVTPIDIYRNANYFRKSAITFPNHRVASDVWLTLKYHPSFRTETTWKKTDVLIPHNAEKLKSNLLSSIKRSITRKKLDKYKAMKNEHDTSFDETYDKYSYYHMLHKHFEKVLFIAKNDKSKACKLLGTSRKKFTYEYQKLKSLGFEFNL